MYVLCTHIYVHIRIFMYQDGGDGDVTQGAEAGEENAGGAAVKGGELAVDMIASLKQMIAYGADEVGL